MTPSQLGRLDLADLFPSDPEQQMQELLQISTPFGPGMLASACMELLGDAVTSDREHLYQRLTPTVCPV